VLDLGGCVNGGETAETDCLNELQEIEDATSTVVITMRPISVDPQFGEKVPANPRRAWQEMTY
jgi:hypothetical protein